MTFVPNLTCARRKRRPMIQQFRNSFLTWYGMRRRADVEVLRPAAEQQVADAAADEVGDVVGLAQPVEHLERVGIDVAARERVLGARDDPRLSHRRALYQFSLFSFGVFPVLRRCRRPRQRHVRARPPLHPRRARARRPRSASASRHLEQQLVVHGQDHPRLRRGRRAPRGRRSSRASGCRRPCPGSAC